MPSTAACRIEAGFVLWRQDVSWCCIRLTLVPVIKMPGTAKAWRNTPDTSKFAWYGGEEIGPASYADGVLSPCGMQGLRLRCYYVETEHKFVINVHQNE